MREGRGLRCKTPSHKSLLQFYGVTGLLRHPDRGDAHWVCTGLHPRDEIRKPGEAPQDAPHDVLGRRDAVGDSLGDSLTVSGAV